MDFSELEYSLSCKPVQGWPGGMLANYVALGLEKVLGIDWPAIDSDDFLIMNVINYHTFKFSMVAQIDLRVSIACWHSNR